jgi:hypothetical protein
MTDNDEQRDWDGFPEWLRRKEEKNTGHSGIIPVTVLECFGGAYAGGFLETPGPVHPQQIKFFYVSTTPEGKPIPRTGYCVIGFYVRDVNEEQYPGIPVHLALAMDAKDIPEPKGGGPFE